MTATAPQLRHYWHTLDNGFWFQNAYERLLSQLPANKPSTWVEIGSFYGGSLAWLGVEILNQNKPVHIHSVDNFTQSPQAEFERNLAPVIDRLGKRFTLHAVDSETAAKAFKPASVDVIWVDADHSYEGVKTDLHAWWDKLKPGGRIGGDDFMPDYAGVEQAVREFFDPKGINVEVGVGQRSSHPWLWWLVRKPE